MAKKILLYIITFMATYAIEVLLFMFGWNMLLCMAWENLPTMSFTQILLTVLGLKCCKFSFGFWYKK